MTQTINRSGLFTAGCFALITTAMSFGLRAGMIPVWQNQFGLTIEDAGWIAATAFWGFTLAMIFGGPLCDLLGIKKLIYIAFAGHLIGIVWTIFSNNFWSFYLSTLVVGVANGLVEAACNPLVTSMYTDEKTKMLNRFHMWFPGGIVIGGLVGYFMTEAGISWKYQIATMLIPNIIYGVMFFDKIVPVTERVSSGVSSGDMYKACIKPFFLLLVFCMMISAATELGTGQLITKLLEGTGQSGLLVLVFINGLMAVGRLFAGPIVHRLSPLGMLLFSSVFSALGLYALSEATGGMTFVAAGVFATGICFFWPTNLGFVSESLPKTGALGLAIMGGAGMLSVSIVLPILGRFLDQQSGAATLKTFAILPLCLSVIFAILYFQNKAKRAQ